ncbi:unnamed protein product [Cochlearia groenlandica]
MDTISTTYDRASEVKAMDEMKIGVRGLSDSGITTIPRIFYDPESKVTSKNSSTTITIPTIDLEGGVFDSATARESVVAKVKDAMEKFGFFNAINHGVSLDVMKEMIDGTRRFHGQDQEVRKKFYTRDKNNKFKYNTNADLFDSPAASWRDTLSCFMAPNGPKLEELPEICGEIMLEYSKQVLKLAELIFELLSEGLGLKTNHLNEMDCGKALLMLCHCYPHCPEPDLTLGARKHTDRSFITILLQDHIGGLEVQYKGDWIQVPPSPGALTINVGDLLQLITNDKFVSVEHMVLANKSKEPRTSIASFFVHPIPSPRIYGPIKELLSEQNPPKYKETTAEVSMRFVARLPGCNASLQALKI